MVGILKSFIVFFAYLISGGIFLLFAVPFSLIFSIFGQHKKTFSKFLCKYMKWAVKDAMPFLQVIEIKEITGLQNIEKSGILITNHQSFLDSFIVLGHIPCVPLIKSSYKFNPLFAWVSPFFDFVGIEYTAKGIMKADEKLRNLLKNKELIWICPEGTRSSDSKIKKFNSLAFKIANDLKVPIFPALIRYSRPIMNKEKSSFIFSQKVEIKFHVLEAIVPQENETTAKLLNRAQTIMQEHLPLM
jgi:1-acyl-sn-glycerol-3-phosphate acyltransferase